MSARSCSSTPPRDRVRGHLHRPGQARPRHRDRADPGHPAAGRQVPAHRDLRQRRPPHVPEGHGPGRKRHGARHLRVQERRPRHHVLLRDKGIFYFAGEGEAPRIVRGFYLDAPAVEKIAARARAARERAGTLAGHALGETPRATGPAFDLLADLAAVVTEPKVWSEEAVTRLAALRPGAYRRGRTSSPTPAPPSSPPPSSPTASAPARSGAPPRTAGREPARHHPRRPHQSHHRT